MDDEMGDDLLDEFAEYWESLSAAEKAAEGRAMALYASEADY